MMCIYINTEYWPEYSFKYHHELDFYNHAGQDFHQRSQLVLRPTNPLTTNVPHHVETSQLICNANELTGYYMLGSIGL